MLPPPFNGPSSGWNRDSDTVTGQDSTTIHMLSHLRLSVFLLNSRSSLVTATSPLLGWHPLSRSYGASLPSSLAVIHSLRLGLLSLWYLCQYSVRTTPRFSRAPGILLIPRTGEASRFGRVLTITVFPQLSTLAHGDGRARNIRMRLLLRVGAGILTSFPFDGSG